MMPEDITAGTTSLVDVLPLVIQHSTISNRLGFLCSLLCTCQQTALAVLDNSIGKVHLRAEAPAQLAWFGKHWRLVRSLRTNAGLWDAAMHEAIEQGLADVAARCREGAAISQLQSYQGFVPSFAVLSHLQPFTTLTSLRMEGIKRINHMDKATACAALGSLVSLRCLDINALISSDLLPATSSLTNLTSLSALGLTPHQGVLNLRHLPPQLQELTMSITTFFAPETAETLPGIDLSHVTGLTRLMAPAVEQSVRDGWVVGLSGETEDKLPPNCRRLSVADVVSAQPLLELQHLERLELRGCRLSDEGVQEALQQLSSLSTLTHLQLNIAMGHLDEGTDEDTDEVAADVLLALPSLRGLRLWYRGLEAGDCFGVDIPGLRTLAKLTALQRLSMNELALPDSIECRLADAFCGLRGLQSLFLCGCWIPELASVVGAIAGLPELRDVCLADLDKWDEAASAVTQLTGLLFVAGRENSIEFASLVGQVHQLSGLRRLWMHSAGMDRFDVDAAAASLTWLTELCLRDCDPHLLGPKFPRATLGHILPGCHLDTLGIDTLNRSAFQVCWWSPDKGGWEKE